MQHGGSGEQKRLDMEMDIRGVVTVHDDHAITLLLEKRKPGEPSTGWTKRFLPRECNACVTGEILESITGKSQDLFRQDGVDWKR